MSGTAHYRELLASPLSLAANLLLVDPFGLGGMHCKARVSAWRSHFLGQVHALAKALGPMIEMPSHTDPGSLIGGVDWAASLHQGSSCFEAGLLSRVHQGLLQIATAERLSASVAGLIAQAQDQQSLSETLNVANSSTPRQAELRFALLLLDESLQDEPAAPAVLGARLAFWIDEEAMRTQPLHMLDAEQIRTARMRAQSLNTPSEVLLSLSHAALAFGVNDLRAPQFALRAYRALQAIASVLGVLSTPSAKVSPPSAKALQHTPGSCDLAFDARQSDEALGLVCALIFAPRANHLPDLGPQDPGPPEAQASPKGPDASVPPASEQAEAGLSEAGQSPAIDTAAMPPKDLPHAESDLQSAAPGTLNAVLAIAVGAAQAMLPAGLLASGAIAAAARTKPGAASGLRTDAGKAGLRGRSLGIREGLPGPKTRLHLLATIRAAAPWQRVRERADDGLRLRIDRADLRVHRFAQSQRVTTVFVVDASGSAALHRLAEVKGAVELLLAQCYVRRDQVAVIAFRLDQARLLLPPTRSLTRAKRQLSALPGGGGTPLASALSLSAKLLENWRKQGQRLQAIVLSDGKANIDIEGKPGRGKAMQDALQQAALLARLAAKGTRLVWVDTAPRPSVEAQSMAQAMAARYMTLPYASAQRLVSLAN